MSSPDHSRAATTAQPSLDSPTPSATTATAQKNGESKGISHSPLESSVSMLIPKEIQSEHDRAVGNSTSTSGEKQEIILADTQHSPQGFFDGVIDEMQPPSSERVWDEVALRKDQGRPTLVSLLANAYRWMQ